MASGVSAGLVARSPEGHAAKGGMPIKDNQDLWVEIQAHTFTNWINEHLRKCGEFNSQGESFYYLPAQAFYGR